MSKRISKITILHQLKCINCTEYGQYIIFETICHARYENIKQTLLKHTIIGERKKTSIECHDREPE